MRFVGTGRCCGLYLGNCCSSLPKSASSDVAEVRVSKDATDESSPPAIESPSERGSWQTGSWMTGLLWVSWMKTLLNDGKSPVTGEQVVPAALLEKISTGVTVVASTPRFPELAPAVYGMGLSASSYQGNFVRLCQ